MRKDIKSNFKIEKNGLFISKKISERENCLGRISLFLWNKEILRVLEWKNMNY